MILVLHSWIRCSGNGAGRVRGENYNILQMCKEQILREYTHSWNACRRRKRRNVLCFASCFSFIHSSSGAVLFWSGLRFIWSLSLGALGTMQEYTPNGLAVHCRTPCIYTQFNVANSPCFGKWEEIRGNSPRQWENMHVSANTVIGAQDWTDFWISK